MRWMHCLVVIAFAGIAGAQEMPRWPQFRGVEGRAVASDAKPLPGTLKNVLWKTPLPEGWSSPCVWSDRIFVTAFDPKAQKLETIAIDRTNGKILWRQTAPAEKIERVYKVNSPASSTPTTDGQRVIVYFGSYGLLCYDLDGKEQWRRPLGPPRAGFGSATSPMFAGELVLLNGQGKDGHVLAVDSKSGKTVWTTEGTPFSSDYPVPMLWKQDKVTEVIVPGRGGMITFDLKDGKRRWWIPGLSPEANSSPAMGDGLLFVATHLPGGDPDRRMTLPPFEEILKKHDKDGDGKLSRKETPNDLRIFQRDGKEGVGEIFLHQMYWLFDKNKDNQIDREEYNGILKTPFNNSLLAIRPGGEGDISTSHIAFQVKRGAPEVPSPLYYQGRVWMVRNGGILTVIDTRTGEEAFPQSRLSPGGIFYASPVAGDGKVYLASDAGVVIVLKSGDRYEVLSETDLGETIRATPALVDGVLYVRTGRQLIAFGK